MRRETALVGQASRLPPGHLALEVSNAGETPAPLERATAMAKR